MRGCVPVGGCVRGQLLRSPRPARSGRLVLRGAGAADAQGPCAANDADESPLGARAKLPRAGRVSEG